MSNKRVSSAEQIRLIQECRSSGLSDSAWCRENNINPGTFYNWVRRRKKIGDYIQQPVAPIPVSQEVVLLDLNPQNDVPEAAIPISKPDYYQSVMRLKAGNIEVSVTNDINPTILAQTLRILQSMSC